MKISKIKKRIPESGWLMRNRIRLYLKLLRSGTNPSRWLALKP